MPNLFIRAKKNYNDAKNIFDEKRDDRNYSFYAAFWLSCAVENLVRYLFNVAEKEEPETHDIDQLVRIAHENDVDLFMSRYISNHVEMFTLWAEREYDPLYQVEEDKIERAIEGVEEYIALIELGLRYGQVYTTDLRHEKALRTAIEALKISDFRSNIKAAFLFGSCARDDQNYWSDVDIGLLTRPGLLQEKGMDDKYFKFIHEMRPKDWESAEIEPHVFYDDGEETTFKMSAKRDAKILWENPDYDQSKNLML